MILTELFNNILPYSLVDDNAKFRTADGRTYGVEFTNDGDGDVDVHFAMVDEENGENVHHATNGGDEFVVFGTVLAIIKDYIQANSITTISFSAETVEPSRIKLYDRMVQKFSQGWTVKTEILHNFCKIYTLTRPDV